MKRIIIGVDEAGRGPLAGQLCVAGVAMKVSSVKKTNFENRTAPAFVTRKRCGRGCGRAKFSRSENFRDKRFSKFSFLSAIRDSKKLSAKQREEWRKIICENFECATAFISSQVIDKIGISKAAALGVARVLRKLLQRSRPRGSPLAHVLLDGALFAPKKYKQQTIIKGDEKIPLIAAASIIAKTSRDAKMLHLHKKFPQYYFNKHKGYGTKLHYKILKKHGLSPAHRRSFLGLP